MGATAALLLLTGLSVPAGAVDPEPEPVPVPVPSVALPVEVDAPSRYEAQSACDPVARPGAVALRDLLVRTYGPATVYITRTCSGSVSEHFDGRAVDWMRTFRDPAQKAQADAFVEWLLAPGEDGTPQVMARRLGIMYIIWNNRMIRTYDVDRGWTDYRGCLAEDKQGPALDTTCHRDHVHLSLSWDGAAKRTSWWTGAALTQPYCQAQVSSATPGVGTPQVVADLGAVPGLVAVDPVTILSTARGTGAGLVAPCRILAGRALHARAQVGGVPEGAAAVAVRVSASSNAPGRLVGWSSGTYRPGGGLPLAIGSTSGTLLVPLSSQGTIALGPTIGAANVTAKVVGYVRAAVTPTPGVTPPPTPVLQPPGAPQKVTARAARRAVVTLWWAPVGAATAQITGYRVHALRSALPGASSAGACRVGPTKRRCTITGLRSGRTYWMSVSVSNPAGRTWAPRVKVRVL